MQKKLRLLGTLLLTIGIIICFANYDWKLVLILFLVITGNNLEQRYRE